MAQYIPNTPNDRSQATASATPSNSVSSASKATDSSSGLSSARPQSSVSSTVSLRSSVSHVHSKAFPFFSLPLILTVVILGAAVLSAIALRFLWKKRAPGCRKAAGFSNSIQPTERHRAGGTAVLVGNAQNIGQRENQQDAFAISDIGNTALCAEKGVFAVVADGMGGLANGAEISNLVATGLLEYFEQSPAGLKTPLLLQKMLFHVNSLANDYLAARGSAKSGTTVAAAVIKNGELFWISVGDSRLYLYREKKLWILNSPHNLATELDNQVLRGELSKYEAMENSQRHALTSYIGIGNLTEYDANIHPFRLQPSDKILLCSDGVFGTVTDAEIASVLSFPPHQAAGEIEKLVLEKRKKFQDNLTVVILEYGT